MPSYPSSHARRLFRLPPDDHLWRPLGPADLRLSRVERPSRSSRWRTEHHARSESHAAHRSGSWQAAKTGIVQGISAAASYPLADILAEKEKMDAEVGPMGIVYQVYLQYDSEKTEEIVREAVDGGVQ